MAVIEVALGLGLAIVGSLMVFGLNRVFASVLEVYRKFNVATLKLRGLTVETAADRRVVTGEAWAEYCDTLKAAGANLLGPGCPTDPFTQAEGYRYLSRLARVTLENFVECGSTDAPRLVALANGWRDAPVHIGSDNPDNVYQSANISGRKEYRVRVKRGTVHFLSFGTQAGSYGGPGGLKTVSSKDASEFEQNEDGTFEIYVSNKQPEGVKNWMQTLPEPEEGMLLVRQTREDHDNEVLAEVEIECVGGTNAPSPLTSKAFEDGLKRSGLFVAGAPIMFTRWAKGFQKHANELPLFDQKTSDKVGGDPTIRYYHSYWRLEHDEALVITATPPDCVTWNFQLNNYWMEALDFRYHQIHVNKSLANYRKDGSVRVVVTTHDPAAKLGLDPKDPALSYFWIETTGHTQGTMCWRWIRPVTDEGLPQPQTRVVKLADLKDALA
ncbi:Hypothetical Protein FCC1311_006352 [Hondaea fermentalgiana]|uniref:DUF1214 domain-containing protein n=1 Tax=Hondaea fermentalgiana TaxID=2315210 RepID=A0A2R5G065_9STRA|nr:Hypothetical Protein FCC1311_006352 [Hondaea fermentalgiana]|eukprot:GBG24417.1 Hypothetical Protein FCC1311_006352 [Hondaea fermentalgiana]